MAETRPLKTKSCALHQTCTFPHANSELRRFSDSFNGLRPVLPIKKRIYGRHDNIGGQSDFSESFKVSDKIAHQGKDKFIGISDSRDTLDDELKQVQYEIDELLDQKDQLEIEMQKRVQEADILTSRIRDIEAQLAEEKNESKRISSKTEKLIKAHGHHIHFLSKKRSQVQLQKLVEGVGLDAAQHIGSEDNSNVNIINDEEIPNMKKDHTSPAKKHIQLHGSIKTPRGSKLANVLKGDNVRIEGSSKRNSPVHFNGNNESDVENKRKETEQLQRNENDKSKRHMDASKGYPSSDNKPEVSKSNIVVPLTSMAGHAVDDFVDQIELDDKTETFETTAVVQNGLTFPLPPPPPMSRNNLIQVRKTTMTSFSSRKRSCSNFSILPRDVTVNILSKLPCTSILRCKVVCKEWFNIVTSDPFFAKRHYENNFVSLLCRKAIIDGYKTKSKNEETGWSYKFEPHNFVDSWYRFNVANSCKGFLLMQEHGLRQEELRTFGIYNPLTNETLFIPELPMDKHMFIYCALGFSPVTEQFKVVVLGNNYRRDTYSLQIYTIEDGSAWRTVSLPESWCHSGIFRHIIWDCNNPIYLNGFLHWRSREERIACFNVEKEEFGEMSPPFVQDFPLKYAGMWEYKGLLWIEVPVYRNNLRETEIWVMKEYGIKESWMRFVVVKHVLASNSIQDHPERAFRLRRPKLVDILDSGEMIFLSIQSSYYDLLSYDPINECFEKLPYPKSYSAMSLNLDIYSPSFFWLKDFQNRIKLGSSVAS